MNLFRRPWAHSSAQLDDTVLGPSDCFLLETELRDKSRLKFPTLLSHGSRQLRLLPYPKSGYSEGPLRVEQLPARPKIGSKPNTVGEEFAAEASSRMHRVLARIEELEASLDDPEHLWDRLHAAWKRAEDESDPRMAEIIRQAQMIRPHLQDLERRIRRVLRRNREMTPLDRVQEMDRASMLWMVRQPGRTTAERAGADQRVLAIVRHQNFDTLENRVLHAYVLLAANFSRQWLREHKRSKSSNRYRQVESYFRFCRRFSRELKVLGVAAAEAGVTANYVLLEDRAYREVREAWDRLLRQDKAEDELWAWQAQSWIDFCVLAVTLSLHALEEAELLAQAPLIWLDEAETGRRFLHDRPLAVFWLRETGLMVEIQARPEAISSLQYAAKASVWLKVTDLSTGDFSRRVPVWTPHCFDRMSPQEEADDALQVVVALRQKNFSEVMRDGLILFPAHGKPESAEAIASGCRVQAIALDAVGSPLGEGMRSLADFVRSCVQRSGV